MHKCAIRCQQAQLKRMSGSKTRTLAGRGDLQATLEPLQLPEALQSASRSRGEQQHMCHLAAASCMTIFTPNQWEKDVDVDPTLASMLMVTTVVST